MTGIPFPDDSLQLDELGSLVAAYGDVVKQQRVLEARRLELLARLSRLAGDEVARVRRQEQEAAAQEERVPVADPKLPEMAIRTVSAEVACVSGVTDHEVVGELGYAGVFAAEYPRLNELLAEGSVGPRQARAVVEEGGIIGDEQLRQRYGEEMVAIAVSETPNRTRRIAMALAATYLAASKDAEERYDIARARRRVELRSLPDGMAELRATLGAVAAHAIMDRLTRQARAVQRQEFAARAEAKLTGTESSDGSDTPAVRPLDQIRSDLFTDLLKNGSPSNETGDVDLSGISARIQVTVPVLSLLPATPDVPGPAHSSPPVVGGAHIAGGSPASRIAGLQGAAILAGYGPIDAETARFLASLDTTWDRISCHPETGEVLAVDAYRPSEKLKRYIFARDQHCRYPGCLVVPHRSDIDHTIDAALGGETSTRNMSVLCRYHHTMKHHAGLDMEQKPDGTVVWTSRLGVHIVDRPTSRVMFCPAPARDPVPEAEIMPF